MPIEIEANIPLRVLLFWDPLRKGNHDWNLTENISRADILKAINEGRLDGTPHHLTSEERLNKKYHIERIAYLVENIDDEPIEISCFQKWII